MKAIGEGMIRSDGYSKVTGTAIYPDDMNFDDMLYASVIRSKISSGILKGTNAKDLRMLPGIVKVIDYDMLPGEKTHGVVFKDIPILVKDIIKRTGDCILIIVATDKVSLKNAIDKAKVNIQPLKGIYTIEDALKEDAPIIGEKSNVLYDINIKKGNIIEGFERAKYISENCYTTQMTEHAFLQPEAAVATYSEDGILELYVATQYPHYDREEVSRALNLEESKVKIHNTTIGGAFGGREDINPQCHVAIASYLTKKPVKIIYTREESTESHSKRHPMKMYYKTGVDSSGKLSAMKCIIYADTGAYASWGINVLRKAAIHATGPYVIPHIEIRAMAIYTNNPYAGAMRGFGAAQVPIAYESQMDILAEKLGINPLKFRYNNSLEIGSRTSTNQLLKSGVALKKCIEKMASIDNIQLS